MFDICFGFIFNACESRATRPWGWGQLPHPASPLQSTWGTSVDVVIQKLIAWIEWQQLAECGRVLPKCWRTLSRSHTHSHTHTHTHTLAEPQSATSDKRKHICRRFTKYSMSIHLSLSPQLSPNTHLSLSLALRYEHLTRFVYLSRRIARLWRPVCVWISSLANPKKIATKDEKRKVKSALNACKEQISWNNINVNLPIL